jgi:F-type H+-transporting ATPase subunit a
MIHTVAALDVHISLAAEELFRVAGFSVTNAMATGFLSLVLFLGIFVYASQMVKRGRYNRFVGFVQWVFELLLEQIDSVIPDKKLARRIAPLALTLFFFILISYWMSILPGLDSIFYNGVPVVRSLAADLNFTFAIAIISLILVQVFAVMQHGPIGNIRRYVRNPLKDPIGAFEGMLELVGEASRYSSLSLRLFGNCFAGEILLVIITVLTGYVAVAILPLFMAFELFIGMIQAYVFFMLTLIFTALAVESHGEAAHESHTSPTDHSPSETLVTSLASRE